MPPTAPRRARRVATAGRSRRWAVPLLVAALLAVAWTGWHAVRGARDLQSAAEDLRAVRQASDTGAQALGALRRAGMRTRSADAHLSDPLVRGVAALPLVGDPLRTAAGLAAAADTTVRDALLPLVEQAGEDPESRLTRAPGTIDVGYLASLAEPARQADAALGRAAAQLAATPERTRVDAVDRARADFAGDFAALRNVVADAALALDLAPDLLGQDRPRRYLVMSQSPSEARGTGGLLGGYTLFEADAGKLRVLRSGSRKDLQSPGRPVVDLGVQFDEHYGTNGAATGWINSNLSPHFPYAAQIWKALWERQYREHLDGAVVLDPIALSYLLRATGPVPLPGGGTVSSEDVADLTMRDVYARFPRLTAADDDRRDALLQQVSAAVTTALTTRPVDGRALLEALDQAVDERRLLLWSADPAVQRRLADEPISGTLPQDRPAVGDVIVDAAGSKLDYYLERDLRYTAGCGDDSRLALVLANAAPPNGLPEYVTPTGFRHGEPPGTNIVLATLYLPPRSIVTGLTLDGDDVFYRQGTELGLEWLEVRVTLRPGQTAELVATFNEPPASDGQVERIAQPLVREETFTAIGC